MAGGAARLARDLEKWAAKLDHAPTRLDVLDYTVARAIATHLAIDVRPDVTREVGGRTLSQGRNGKGYRAGVWAAPHRGNSADWWVGSSGKLHWLDLGTSPHLIPPKRRSRRGKGRTLPDGRPLMIIPDVGPRWGPFHHLGHRGSGVYRRSEQRHQRAALQHGAKVVERLIAETVMPHD